MNLAILRIEGPDESLANIVSALGFVVDTSYKKGDARRGGKFHDSSGVSISVADAETPRKMMDEIRGFLDRVAQLGLTFPGIGLDAQIDIGLGVGTETQFVASIELSPEDMAKFATIGLTLCVTGYPCSDDEPNEGITTGDT